MRRYWDAGEDADLREFYPHFRSEFVARVMGRSIAAITGRARIMDLHKSAKYLAGPSACRLRRGGSVGAPYRFPKGHVPANKGVRRPGYAPGRMADTQFKKGQDNHNKMPLFSERLIGGYRYVKIAEVRFVPHTVNWKPVHVLDWERANGRAMRRGECLRFRDGNRLNVALSNLELITRGENGRRNSLHRLPEPIRRAIHAVGALNRRLNRKEKERADRQHA